MTAKTISLEALKGYFAITDPENHERKWRSFVQYELEACTDDDKKAIAERINAEGHAIPPELMALLRRAS